MMLVCDDQPEVLVALDLLLKDAGYPARMTDSPRAALDELASGRAYDLVLTDMNFARDTTSGREGLELVESICRAPQHPPVVVMTAWADVELAMEAVHRGASDFVRKPWDNARLLAALDRARAQAGQPGQGEMESARLVQQRLLPNRRHTAGRLTFEAAFEPAGEVGGDYYDFFDLGRGDAAFLLADVSGKGVPAAMLMANLQALFHSQPAALLAQPARLAERINGLFFRSTAPAHYATLFYGHYREATGEIVYVNCGNPPASYTPRAGPVRPCGATGLPVGLFGSARWEEARIATAPGDRLVICSDGITEAEFGVVDDRTQVTLTIGGGAGGR